MTRSERWSEPEEIKRILAPAGQEGGGPVLYRENQRCWAHTGESNGIFLGVTGAGKSYCGTQNLVRSLIDAHESFFAVDPKGELYRRNACRLGKDYLVHVIDFSNMLQSERVNVLRVPYELYRSGDPLQQKDGSEMLEDLAYTLYPDPVDDSPFWVSSARSLFLAAAYALMEAAQPEQVNMASIQNIVMQGDKRCSGGHSPLLRSATYLERLLELLPENSVVNSELYSYVSTASDTRGGIRSTMLDGLSCFLRSDVLRGFIGGDDLDINGMDGSRPLAIWLILPDEAPMYSKLAAIIIDQLMHHFVSLARKKYGGRLPRRMNFLLEEAGNIGRISALSRMMSAGRSRNIRTFLVLQSLSQLENIYGKSDARTIRDNADLLVLYRTNDLFTLREISELCGSRVWDDAVERSSGPLITPAQLAALRTGQALVMLDGGTKFVADLPPCTEAFDPSGWQEPQPCREPCPHEKPPLFDLVRYVDEKDREKEQAEKAAQLPDLPEAPFERPSFSSLLQGSRPEHAFDLDPTKPYQVLIKGWNGHKIHGIKILVDHYKAPLREIVNTVEPLPHMLPFDSAEDAAQLDRLLKDEGVFVGCLGFDGDEDDDCSPDEDDD